ncbi:hypothetical protein GCM10020358_75760 [Amorphoplanes nipponensis]|uniref:Uncharacterized protein n=1 Tax=Actinoplanes nipponensis TaxID=135950 RepID=A0A919MM04_9ACTN|nr:hypothetical protein Ani05nite_35950 [Actinoplanes nipponensis]
MKFAITASTAVSGRFMYVWDRSTWQYHVVQGDRDSPNGTAQLPPGDYVAVARYGYFRQRNYLLVRTFTVTSAAVSVTFAESGARETAFATDDATAVRATSAYWLELGGGDKVGFTSGGPAKTYVTPFAVAGVTLRLHELLTKAGSSAAVPSPYRYDLQRSWSTVPASPIAKVTTAQLAKTVTTLRAQGVTTNAALGSSLKDRWSGSYLESPVRLPGTVTEYVTPGPTVHRKLTLGAGDSSVVLPDRALPAGESPGTTVGAGPFLPRAAGSSVRDGDELRMSEPAAYADADGNAGSDARASVTAKLTTEGDVHHYDQTFTRRVAWSQLSTRIRSEWDFRAPDQGPLPLIDLGVGVTGLDARNRAGAAAVGITASASARGGGTAEVGKVEYSTDDGAEWTELDGDTLTVPATAAFVSLRVTATDDRDGRLRRTVIRAFAGPATAPDETSGATRISNVVVNGGADLTFGVSGSRVFTATFTASDPAGIAGGDAYLYHGAYATPDGVILATGPADCEKTSNTAAVCTARFAMDVKVDAARNALAGAWTVAAWSHAADGTSFADRHAAGAFSMKRVSKLTVDASPEPVTKGKTITVTGTLTRAGWESWTYQGYGSRTVTLQYSKKGTTAWKTVKSVKTDSAGKLKTTVKASADGSFRWTYAGDAASTATTGPTDYVDVR